MNISKELLGEVLNKNISSYEFDVYGNIDYKILNDYGSCINIYELAHKCKEWAANIGFNISSTSGYRGDNTPYAYAISSDGEEFPFIEADTEVESVFKVCEWILNNKDKLNG